MPFVPAPGVAQSVLKGTIGPNQFAMIWHWMNGTSTGPWNSTDIQHLADHIFNDFKVPFQTLICQEATFVQCQTVDIGTSTPNLGASTAATWPGFMSDPPEPFSASQMILFHIGARYRGGKPRTYLPPPGFGASANGDTWDNTHRTNLNSAWTTFINNVHSDMAGLDPGPLVHVVPRFTYTYVDDPVHHKWLKHRATYIGASPVTSYVVSGQIRSQRRRLGP